MKKRLLFLMMLTALIGIGQNAWAIESLRCEFLYSNFGNENIEFVLYYGDVPRASLPPEMSYADDILLVPEDGQIEICINSGTSCKGIAYGAFVDRDVEFYAALTARDPVTGLESGFSEEVHYDPNAQSVPGPPQTEGFIPEPSFIGLSLCQDVDGLADGTYLLTVSGANQTVYAGVCETGYSLSLFSTSVEITEGESVTLKANGSGTNVFTVDGVTKCTTSSATCTVSGLSVGTHTASVSNNGTMSNSLVITVSAPVVSSSIFDGLSSGDYRVRLDANGSPTVVEVLGNNPPTISISADKVGYIEGETPATIAVAASDPEGDALTTACYADGSLMSGLTTGSFLVGSHSVYCVVSDGTNSVSSNSLTVTVLDGPHMSLPASISLEANVGDGSASANITVANSGNGFFNCTATSTATWLTLSESACVSGDVITSTANLNGLLAGTYNGSVIFESPDTDNPSVVVPVTLTIADANQNTASLDVKSLENQYAYISDINQKGLDITGDFAIEARIKLRQLPSQAGRHFAIVSKTATDGPSSAYRFFILSNNKLRVDFFAGSSNTNITADIAFGPGDIGVWKRVAVAVDVSVPSAVMYVDGQTFASSVISGGATTLNNSSANLYIGRDQLSNMIFDGLVDEVRIWSVARTADQIISNQDKSIDAAPGLQGSWHLNGNYVDSSGNGNHLIPVGNPVFSTDAP